MGQAKLPGCWGDAGGRPQLQGGDQAWSPSPPLHHHQPLDARRGIFAPCLSQMIPGDQHPPSQGREGEALSNPRTICWLRTDQSAAALRWRLQSHPGVLLAQHRMQPGAPQGATQSETGALLHAAPVPDKAKPGFHSLKANPSHRSPKSRLRNRLGLLAPRAGGVAAGSQGAQSTPAPPGQGGCRHSA